MGELEFEDYIRNFPEDARKILESARNEIKEEEKKYHHRGTIRGGIRHFMDFIDLAEQFVKKQPIYYDVNKLWWIYNKEKSRWEIIDETDIMNAIDDALGVHVQTTKSQVKNEILESLQRVGRKYKPAKIKSTWIQLGEEIVDLETNEVFDALSKYFTVNPIPWKIGWSDSTPNMDHIFEQWVGKEYVQTLYEIIAYSMLPSYPISRIFCLNGSGRNGKSKFISLLIKFLGQENCCSTNLDTLMDSRFESAKLYKKLLCTMGETNFTALKKTQMLKRLTGEDFVGVEFKNKNPFEMVNYAKIIIATNSLPITFDKTEGFYRRWLIIDFPNKFSEKKDILADIPEEEYNNLAKKCIGILQNLLNKREFANEGDIQQRQERYEKLSNPVVRFIDEKCEKDINEKIMFLEFYDKICDFLAQNKYRNMSKREVSDIIRSEGIDTEKDNYRKVDGTMTKVTFIHGIKWKEKKKIHEPDKQLSDYNKEEFKTLSPEEEVIEKIKHIQNTCTDNTDGIIPLSKIYSDISSDNDSGINMIIERMKKDGILFEPRPGFVKLL